jgi:hypothetical protein
MRFVIAGATASFIEIQLLRWLIAGNRMALDQIDAQIGEDRAPKGEGEEAQAGSPTIGIAGAGRDIGDGEGSGAGVGDPMR